MSRLQKRGKQEKPVVSDGAEKVIVAVKASREIPKTALIWALTHVVQPGDCITLIVVVPSHNSGTFLAAVLLISASLCFKSCVGHSKFVLVFSMLIDRAVSLFDV